MNKLLEFLANGLTSALWLYQILPVAADDHIILKKVSSAAS